MQKISCGLGIKYPITSWIYVFVICRLPIGLSRLMLKSSFLTYWKKVLEYQNDAIQYNPENRTPLVLGISFGFLRLRVWKIEEQNDEHSSDMSICIPV